VTALLHWALAYLIVIAILSIAVAVQEWWQWRRGR
jgi:hypothetical protein